MLELLKRPEISIENIKHFVDFDYSDEVVYQIMINAKYGGYIEKANREAKKMLDLEEKKIPDDIDYSKIPNIASEAREKLDKIRPTSIRQATMISGVNPADISVLMVYLRKEEYNGH